MTAEEEVIECACVRMNSNTLDSNTRTGVQAYLAHKKGGKKLGSPQVPKHEATVGSYEGGVSYERGTPVYEERGHTKETKYMPIINVESDEQDLQTVVDEERGCTRCWSSQAMGGRCRCVCVVVTLLHPHYSFLKVLEP